LRRYQGTTDTDKNGGRVVVVTKNGFPKILDPKPSQKLWNHSPNGFNWGYAGSGPAQLALAILLDVTGDKALSSRLHQAFKSEIVSTWPAGQVWVYTEDQVKAWLDVHKEERCQK
jgi:hypothetical protein